MDQLSRLLLEEKKHMEKLLKISDKERLTTKTASIRACKHGKSHQYYICEGNHYRYLPKSDHHIAKSIIQSTYAKKIHEEAARRHYHINQLLKNPININEHIYQSFPEGKQAMIDSYEISKEDFIKAWEAKEYMPNPYEMESTSYYTKKNECVRSKSEIIIADTMNDLGIPYKYEHPFTTTYGEIIYPDFLILNPNTLHEAYYEHFGLMDNPEYVVKTVHKIEAFGKKGFFLGTGLLATFENGYTSIDTRMLREMLEQWLETY